MEKMLNIDDVADILDISRSTFNRIRGRGGGPKEVRLGKQVRFREEDVWDWLEEKRNNNG